MTNCIFCNKGIVTADRLYETSNFFVGVGFGLIAAGQVMTIPKTHYRCYGDLPDELEEESSGLRKLVDEKVSRAFSLPVQVEMGVWGQSVNHAHIHFIPSKSDEAGNEYSVTDVIAEMVEGGPERVSYEETDRRGLKEIYRKEGGYVSLEQGGRLYVCHIDGRTADSANFQLLPRNFFQMKKGRVNANGKLTWSNMSDEDKKQDDNRRALTRKLLVF